MAPIEELREKYGTLAENRAIAIGKIYASKHCLKIECQ
ncbi:Uncharacterised protein [Providencia stuartii]|nr:Uncharacterised protein [Providencia stuartii]